MWFNRGFISQLDTRELRPAPPEGLSKPGPKSRPEMRVRFGETPCAALASEIETGNVRALFSVGGNIAPTFPDSRRTSKALASLETLVVLEVVETATTALATHVLPCSAQLERADIPVELDTLLERVMSQRTPAIVSPSAGVKPMWWWFARLAQLLGNDVMPVDADWNDDAIIDAIIASSRDPQALSDSPTVVMGDGATFGWVTERVIPEGRWRLAPGALVGQLGDYLAETRQGLLMVPRRRATAINSREISADDEGAGQVLVNPADASAADLVDGETIRVTSATGGTAEGVLRTTELMMAGSVSMSFGGATPDVNSLTCADTDVDSLTGMPRYSGVRVKLTRADPAASQHEGGGNQG